MTRSSNKDLIKPFDQPKRVFHSNLKLFKTQSLDYSNSSEFDLFSEYEDQCEEEETETMTEPTMEDGSDNEDANEHIEKVLEIVDLLHIPSITQDRGLDVPTRQILDSKCAIPSMKAANAKKAIQEMADHSQKWHNGTSTRCRSYELCKGPHYTKDCPLKEERKTLKEAYYTQFGVSFPQGGQYKAAALENSNLIKKIRASTNAAIRNQGASIKALEIQIGKISKVLQRRGFGNLPSSTKTNSRDHVKSILTIVETDTTSIRRIEPSRYAVSVPQNSKLFFVPNQVTIPFPSRLYDDCCNEEEGSYELKDLEDIEDYLKILKDIKHGPYYKKPPICRIDLNQYGVSTIF
nr:hypothetical protein [Tanacetum cinerariifolium]